MVSRDDRIPSGGGAGGAYSGEIVAQLANSKLEYESREGDEVAEPARRAQQPDHSPRCVKKPIGIMVRLGYAWVTCFRVDITVIRVYTGLVPEFLVCMCRFEYC